MIRYANIFFLHVCLKTSVVLRGSTNNATDRAVTEGFRSRRSSSHGKLQDDVYQHSQ